jgi:NAD(P)-dependent dehydrogenase (short-subunit alcohol dehydrogenase family)
MRPLTHRVAGGSRGAGRDIALALGDAGATVFVVGRTSRTGTVRPNAPEVPRFVLGA